MQARQTKHGTDRRFFLTIKQAQAGRQTDRQEREAGKSYADRQVDGTQYSTNTQGRNRWRIVWKLLWRVGDNKLCLPRHKEQSWGCGVWGKGTVLQTAAGGERRITRTEILFVTNRTEWSCRCGAVKHICKHSNDQWSRTFNILSSKYIDTEGHKSSSTRLFYVPVLNRKEMDAALRLLRIQVVSWFHFLLTDDQTVV